MSRPQSLPRRSLGNYSTACKRMQGASHLAAPTASVSASPPTNSWWRPPTLMTGGKIASRCYGEFPSRNMRPSSKSPCMRNCGRNMNKHRRHTALPRPAWLPIKRSVQRRIAPIGNNRPRSDRVSSFSAWKIDARLVGPGVLLWVRKPHQSEKKIVTHTREMNRSATTAPPIVRMPFTCSH